LDRESAGARPAPDPHLDTYLGADGTGLGLAIVLECVPALSGDMSSTLTADSQRLQSSPT
jgi:hypothetical protein